MIKLKKTLVIIVIILSALSCNQQSNKIKNNSSKPNILLILADDAGYADFGFMGSKDLLTPNIDQLAAQGVVFTDAHVTATVCSPSRAGLITGRYQERFGHECNIPPYGLGTDITEITLADVLKDAGYAIAIAVHTPMQAKDEDLKKFESHARQKLAAMIWSLDEAIGNVFNKLDA